MIDNLISGTFSTVGSSTFVVCKIAGAESALGSSATNLGANFVGADVGDFFFKRIFISSNI